MAQFKFDSARTCPKCQASFSEAEQLSQYDPVIVVKCPGCGATLWRPGSEVSSALFVFDPNADAGGL
jgi:hypothetical protein